MTKEAQVDRILNRGIIKEVLPSQDELRKRLLSDEPMRFYIGADPTGPSLHLSHAKNFMLLEEFRQLGHKVFVLFGDFTACIGDPTDRSSTRARLTRAEAKKNVEAWVSNIRPIINFDDPDNPAEVVLNSTWFDKMSPQDIIELLAQTTVQRMLERDMFEKRIAEGKPIHLHEFVYPLFQGRDSVELNVDAELCGTDQIFNALTGRDLLKRERGKEKFVVAVTLMENPKTGELMSKSNGTGVFLGTDAKTMFGQVMAQPDEMIEVLLTCNTRIPLEEIKALNIAANPRDAKLRTAHEITRLFYGVEAADEAQENFVSTFSDRSFPEDAPRVQITEPALDLLALLKQCHPDRSNGELRRLADQGAVSIAGDKVTDPTALIEVKGPLEVKVGKRGFFVVEPAA